MMRQRTGCQHSPTLKSKQHIPEVFSPLQSHITVSPGQRDCHAQKVQHPYYEYKQLLHPEDVGKIPHVRKVSVSMPSPPYPRVNTEFRSRNNASPAVSSSGSCSSWSGDESEDDDHRIYKQTNENDEVRSKGKCTVRSDNSNRMLPNKAVEQPLTPSNSIQRSHLHLPCFESASHKSQTVSSRGGVAVARVVGMPATDGLRRILEDGHPSQSLLPGPGAHKHQQLPRPHPPYSWTPRMNGLSQQYNYQHHRQQHHYPTSPSPVAGDRRLYTPPPPQGSFRAPHISPHTSPHEGHHPQQQQLPPLPQMLPMGMEILLRDPATGRERSYRVQYTHKYMTGEEANQFQRLHDGGLQNAYHLQGNNANHSSRTS